MVLAAQQVKRPSLTSDFSWTFVGNVVYAGGQFATLMLLAKLLPPESVGQYALSLAIVYPVMMFTNLQFRAVITSGSRQEIAFGYYLGLRLLTTTLAFPVIFVITQVLGYGWELKKVILMVGLAYAVETVSDVYYAWLQWHDRMAEISKSMIVRALLSVLGLAVTTYVTRNLLWGIAWVVLARVGVLCGYDICERTHGLGPQATWFSRNRDLAPRFNIKTQGALLWLSLPLGIVVLLGCLNSSVPNFFIKHAVGEREVGIFAAIGFMVSTGNMAVVSLGQSAFTRLSRACAAGDLAAFRSILGKQLAFGAAIGVCGMFVSRFAGREILTFLFRPEYAERANLLPWVMAAGGVLFMAQFAGFGLTAANFYYSQVVLNILANLSLLLACYWLVPHRGLLGAILAMLIAAMVQLAASVFVLVIGMRQRFSVSAKKTSRPGGMATISVSTERRPALHGN